MIMENKNRTRSVIGNRRPSRPQNTRRTSQREDTKVFNFKPSNLRQRRGDSQQSERPQRSQQGLYANRDQNAAGQFRQRSRRPAQAGGGQPQRPQQRPAPQREYPIPEPVERKPRKRRGFGRLLLTLALLVILGGGALGAGVLAYAKLGTLNPDLSGDPSLYNISANAAAVAASHRIANVAVFGVDGREDVEGERSDAIMIGSADYEHNKLKVTSLMRDTYTEMADEDYFDKLNAAYSIGGPMEAVRTINLNFDTAITDYVVIDFTALVAMVNAVGGVDINISDEEELYWVNQYLMDVNDKVGTADPDVPDIGPQHLTGSQALSYARIRYTGNGDYDRTQRQRNILQQVVAKASAMSIPQQLALIQSVMPYIETSLRPSEMVKYALNVVLMDDKSIEQSRLPADGLCTDGYLDGISYIFPDTLVDNIKAWYSFVYEIDYTPSETAEEISEEIESIWW